jgi:hypothetical protein
MGRTPNRNGYSSDVAKILNAANNLHQVVNWFQYPKTTPPQCRLEDEFPRLANVCTTVCFKKYESTNLAEFSHGLLIL